MEIANLKQPPLDTTLMGCVKGASDYFENDLSTAMLFGLTGHAFLINVHGELCPSGPYCWNHDKFFELLGAIGMRGTDWLTRTKGTPAEDVEDIEHRVKTALDEGKLCILDSKEHQLVSGYDEKGFTILRPWGDCPSEVGAITYGGWDECMEKMDWSHLTIIEGSPVPESLLPVAKEALLFALEMRRDPGKYAEPSYSMGYGAYEAWISAVAKGSGTSHGHWWNAMVWSECRRFASEFFYELSELAEDGTVTDICGELAPAFSSIGDSLRDASDRSKGKEEQIELLTAALETERDTEPKLEALAAAL